MSTIDYDALLKNELSLVEALSEFFSYDVKVAERFNRTVYIEMYSDEKLESGKDKEPGNAVWKESFYCNYKDLI
jgi:hypothetical protein